MKTASTLVALLAFLAVSVSCSEKKPIVISQGTTSSTQGATTSTNEVEPNLPKEEPVPPEVKLPVPFDFAKWQGMTVTKEETLPACATGWFKQDKEKELQNNDAAVDLGSDAVVFWNCDGRVDGLDFWERGVSIGTTSQGLIRLLTYAAGNNDYDERSIRKFKVRTKPFHDGLIEFASEKCVEDSIRWSSKISEENKSELEDSIRIWKCGDYSILDMYNEVDLLLVFFSGHELNAGFFNNFAKVFESPEWGKVIKVGNFSYTMEEGSLEQSVGSHMRYSASKGGTFVIIKYLIANDTNTTQTVAIGDLTLTDHKGRSFKSSSKGQMAVAMQHGISVALDEIQPGLPQTQFAVFEVPEDAVADMKRLTLTIPEKGLLKAGAATFELWFR